MATLRLRPDYFLPLEENLPFNSARTGRRDDAFQVSSLNEGHELHRDEAALSPVIGQPGELLARAIPVRSLTQPRWVNLHLGHLDRYSGMPR